MFFFTDQLLEKRKWLSFPLLLFNRRVADLSLSYRSLVLFHNPYGFSLLTFVWGCIVFDLFEFMMSIIWHSIMRKVHVFSLKYFLISRKISLLLWSSWCLCKLMQDFIAVFILVSLLLFVHQFYLIYDIGVILLRSQKLLSILSTSYSLFIVRIVRWLLFYSSSHLIMLFEGRYRASWNLLAFIIVTVCVE